MKMVSEKKKIEIQSMIARVIELSYNLNNCSLPPSANLRLLMNMVDVSMALFQHTKHREENVSP